MKANDTQMKVLDLIIDQLHKVNTMKIKNEKIIAVRKYYADNSDEEHVFKAYTNAMETKLTVEYTYKGIKDTVELILDDNDGVGDIIQKLNEWLVERITRYIVCTVNFNCQHNLPSNNKDIELLFDKQERLIDMISNEGALYYKQKIH